MSRIHKLYPSHLNFWLIRLRLAKNPIAVGKYLSAVSIINLLFLSFISTCFALDTDQKEKLHITADSGSYNFKTGIDIYEGHVKIDQGTTHITADKLITKKNTQRKIEEAIAYGFQSNAHYWTIPKIEDPEIHAYAKIIKFYPITSNVTLEHDVFITQDENHFKGELIHYNGNDQVITLPSSPNGRATLVYNPDK